MQRTGASRAQITYTQRLMKSDKGRRQLCADEPEYNRAAVTEGHIRAVRQILNSSGQLFDAAWKV